MFSFKIALQSLNCGMQCSLLYFAILHCTAWWHLLLSEIELGCNDAATQWDFVEKKILDIWVPQFAWCSPILSWPSMMFSIFSMFSQFSPCSPIRHCKISQFVKPCIILETLIVMNKRRNYFPSGHQWWWQAFVLPRGDFYTLYFVYSFAILLSPIWSCRWSIWAEKPSRPTNTSVSEKSPSSGPISEIMFRVIINTRISMIITNVNIIVMIIRYGLKMAQCIRSNDFNCLGGIYDQATSQSKTSSFPWLHPNIRSHWWKMHELWQPALEYQECWLFSRLVLMISVPRDGEWLTACTRLSLWTTMTTRWPSWSYPHSETAAILLTNLTIMSKQRGHGGGGGVLTASNQIEGNPAFHNDWQYKVTPLRLPQS